MQCPDCGYEADDAAFFCPQCRYQFREAAGEPEYAGDPVSGQPDRGIITDEQISEERTKGFPAGELRQLEVQLLQPAVLVVLIIALFTYTVIAMVPFVPLTVAGLSFSITGVICLTCGLVCGYVFFFLARRWVRNFRCR
jgi:hypothetical protein